MKKTLKTNIHKLGMDKFDQIDILFLTLTILLAIN